MKVSCEIIKDLLPLYHDKVCSAESNVLVEKHIEECNSCKQIMSIISDEFTCPANMSDEAKPIKAIQAVWKRDKSKSFFKGALISVLICAVLAGGFFILTQWKIPVSADMIEISEISQLSDGRIVYFLTIKDKSIKPGSLHSEGVYKDGNYYMTPMRNIINLTQFTETDKSSIYSSYIIINIAAINEMQQKYGDGTMIKSCYAGTFKHAVLIWEEGMEIPSASDELEKMFFEYN